MTKQKWFNSFMRWHPQLLLWQPEFTLVARSKGFNRADVQEFFDLLEKLVEEKGLTAPKILI